MAEQLIIRLASQDKDKIHWLVWSQTEQHIIASGELANIHHLGELTEKAAQRKLIVLLPSSDVSLKLLNVPAKSKKAMQLAAPYVIEDDVAQDVASLFFAYDNFTTESGNCPLAFVERGKMQHWMAKLSAAALQPDIALPEVLAMPESDSHWQAIMLDEQIIVRQGKWQGATIDAQLWSQMATIWQQSNPELTIDAYSPLPTIHGDITIRQQPEELPLALMAQQINSKSFNMLQGAFAVKKQRSPILKTWGVAASIAIAAILLNLVGNGIAIWQLAVKTDAVEAKIIERYKQTFPDTQRVRIATVRSQLKGKLARLAGAEKQGDFLAMLTKLEPAFIQVPNMKPDNMRYDGKRGELRMQAKAKSYQDFEKFQTALKQHFTVSQGALNNQGTEVSGAISIKETNGSGS